MSADRVGGAVLNAVRNSFNILQGKVDVMGESIKSSNETNNSNSKSAIAEIQHFTTTAEQILGELKQIKQTLESIEQKQQQRATTDSEMQKKLNEALSSNAKLLESNNKVVDANKNLESLLDLYLWTMSCKVSIHVCKCK